MPTDSVNVLHIECQCGKMVAQKIIDVTNSSQMSMYSVHCKKLKNTSKWTCLTKASQGLHVALLTIDQSTDDLPTLHLNTVHASTNIKHYSAFLCQLLKKNFTV